LFLEIVTDLPPDAMDTLDLVEQICAETDETAIAMLLPEQRVKLLYLHGKEMRGKTYGCRFGVI